MKTIPNIIVSLITLLLLVIVSLAGYSCKCCKLRRVTVFIALSPYINVNVCLVYSIIIEITFKIISRIYTGHFPRLTLFFA